MQGSFVLEENMLVEILREILQSPETPNPWDLEDTEVYI